MDDVLLNKAGIIERCWRRVADEYAGTPSRLVDQTHQDAIILNLERACQAAIDAAMYLVVLRPPIRLDTLGSRMGPRKAAGNGGIPTEGGWPPGLFGRLQAGDGGSGRLG